MLSMDQQHHVMICMQDNFHWYPTQPVAAPSLYHPYYQMSGLNHIMHLLAGLTHRDTTNTYTSRQLMYFYRSPLTRMHSQNERNLMILMDIWCHGYGSVNLSTTVHL